MYAEEKLKDLKRIFLDSAVLLKLLLVTFTDGNHKINRVTKDTHKFLAYTFRELDARAYIW